MRQVRRTAVLCFAVVIWAHASSSEGVSPASGDESTVPFTVSGVDYAFALPDGFALVSGKDRERAEFAAQHDARNITHFTAIPRAEAGREGGFVRWAVLKTPRGSIGKRIPSRSEWVASAKGKIGRPELAGLLDDAAKLAGKRFEEVFGGAVKLGAHMELVDVDEYASYTVGTMSLRVGEEAAVVACAFASTIVRGNVFFYYRFRPYSDASDVAALLAQVKPEVRRFVVENPD